jgi:Flp pilus assembly pilin Flp
MMLNSIAQMLSDESGATAIEYGLIAGAVGLVLIASMPGLSGAVSDSIGQFAGPLADNT